MHTGPPPDARRKRKLCRRAVLRIIERGPGRKSVHLQRHVRACERADRTEYSRSVCICRFAQAERIPDQNDTAVFDIGISLYDRHRITSKKLHNNIAPGEERYNYVMKKL